MKDISFEEAKRLELEILVKVADFCEKHGLRYYLAYGTLIGAVRHKGFIPWDDDIDIWMPRPDYEKLMEIFNTENEDKNFHLIVPTAKESGFHTYVKVINVNTDKTELGKKKGSVLGVDIDIFPLDGQPEQEKDYESWYHKLMRLYKRYTFSCKSLDGYPLKTKLHILLYRGDALWRDKIFAEALKLHAQYPYERCKFVGATETIDNGIGNRFEREWFEDSVMLEFEGLSFRAPKGYHEILTKIYGDYMQLPPESQRVTHHTNTMKWKD